MLQLLHIQQNPAGLKIGPIEVGEFLSCLSFRRMTERGIGYF